MSVSPISSDPLDPTASHPSALDRVAPERVAQAQQLIEAGDLESPERVARAIEALLLELRGG